MRTINADLVMLAIENVLELHPLEYERVKKEIAKIPTIDPVKHGHWVSKSIYDVVELKCSECGYLYFDYPYEYCPHCGAKMDGDDK